MHQVLGVRVMSHHLDLDSNKSPQLQHSVIKHLLLDQGIKVILPSLLEGQLLNLLHPLQAVDSNSVKHHPLPQPLVKICKRKDSVCNSSKRHYNNSDLMHNPKHHLDSGDSRLNNSPKDFSLVLQHPRHHQINKLVVCSTWELLVEEGKLRNQRVD